MSSNSSNNDEDFELTWLQTRKDVGLPDLNIFNEETTTEKFARKFKENPLVPIGCVLTTACLTLGLFSMRTGNRKMSQLMMRGRIVAQGFTIAAVITGLCIKASE